MQLEKVTVDNFYDLMCLSVREEQHSFVAPNAYSLAEAYAVLAAGRYVQPFGIYEEDTPVGFAMIGHNSFLDDDQPSAYRDSYYIWRFMIDKQFQGRGLGKAAVQLVLDFIRSFPDGETKTCCLSYEPHNKAAKNLYASFGFRPNGEMDGDEEVAVLQL